MEPNYSVRIANQEEDGQTRSSRCPVNSMKRTASFSGSSVGIDLSSLGKRPVDRARSGSSDAC